MNSCDDVRYVQANACGNFFWHHQTPISHETCRTEVTQIKDRVKGNSIVLSWVGQFIINLLSTTSNQLFLLLKLLTFMVFIFRTQKDSKYHAHSLSSRSGKNKEWKYSGILILSKNSNFYLLVKVRRTQLLLASKGLVWLHSKIIGFSVVAWLSHIRYLFVRSGVGNKCDSKVFYHISCRTVRHGPRVWPKTRKTDR